MAKKDIIRSIIFIFLCLGMFVYLNQVFSLADSDENTKTFNSFYAEKENSLDGVFLGSSATNRFWNGPRAYNKNGLSIFGFSTSSQPLVLYPYLIEEVEKTQDPQLYILELRDVQESADDIMEEGIRRATDNMKASPNRIKAINAAVTFAEKGDNDVDKTKIDYYLPLLKYHSRWQADDFSSKDILLKNTCEKTKGYLLGKKSFGQVPAKATLYTSKTKPLDKDMEDVLRGVLSYCDNLDAEVLFVLSPYSEQSADEVEQMNEAARMVEESGYPMLNFNTKSLADAVGLDWEKDYYDTKHVNVAGAEKYTDFLAGYIWEHYDLPDRRDDPEYKSWDDAYQYYLDYVAEHKMDVQE